MGISERNENVWSQGIFFGSSDMLFLDVSVGFNNSFNITA